MARILILFAAFLCGCSPPRTRDKGDYAEARDYNGNMIYVQIVEHKGHRFAVAHAGGHVSICEVTDASLIKGETNAAHIKTPDAEAPTNH